MVNTKVLIPDFDPAYKNSSFILTDFKRLGKYDEVA